MKTYPKYKDSGVPWLGEVPEGWELVFLRSIFAERKCKNVGMQENNLLSLSYGKIVRKPISKVTGLTPHNYEGYNIVQKNDIVLRLTDLQNDQKSLRSGLVGERGIVTSAYLSLRPKGNRNSAFYQYQLYVFDTSKSIYSMGNGVRQTFGYKELSKLPMAVPTAGEQQKIVDYLDRKCTEIDELISRRQQMIEKLRELKRSIIAQAVTKGIRSNRPMKDSGVPWLGEMPKEWEIRRISQILRAFSERGCNEQELLSVYLERGVIRYSESDGTQVHKPSKDLSNYQVVTPGDLVCNNQQAWRGSVGVSKYEGRISPAYIVFKIHSMLHPQYANYLFRSRAWNPAFVLSSKGVGSIQRNLYLPWFKQHRVPIPAVAEQQEIADYLDKKCAEIDEMIARHTGIIEKLKELKVSLIANVVTGKVDVRTQSNS